MQIYRNIIVSQNFGQKLLDSPCIIYWFSISVISENLLYLYFAKIPCYGIYIKQ